MQTSPRRVRERFQDKLFIVPGLVTVASIFCGFMSLVSSLQASFSQAALFILVALIFDGLDGRVARRLNATSEFGKEFDSLSDVISFGVAPAFLVYCWSFMHWAPDIGAIASFFFAVCTATRLARFNVNTSSEQAGDSFTGIPSPGAAAAIASIVYLYPDAMPGYPVGIVVMLYTVIVAALMVSTVKFFSAKSLQLESANSRVTIILLAVAVAFAWKYTRLVVFAISTLYVMSGIFMAFARMVKGKDATDMQELESSTAAVTDSERTLSETEIH